jgi:hypothetical protein
VLVRETDAARTEAVLRGGIGDLPPEFTDDWEPSTRMAGTRRKVRGCLITGMIVTLALIMVVLVPFVGR